METKRGRSYSTYIACVGVMMLVTVVVARGSTVHDCQQIQFPNGHSYDIKGLLEKYGRENHSELFSADGTAVCGVFLKLCRPLLGKPGVATLRQTTLADATFQIALKLCGALADPCPKILDDEHSIVQSDAKCGTAGNAQACMYWRSVNGKARSICMSKREGKPSIEGMRRVATERAMFRNIHLSPCD